MRHDTPTRCAEIAADKELTACEAVGEIYKAYARRRPGVLFLLTLGIGFLLGWKLNPW